MAGRNNAAIDNAMTAMTQALEQANPNVMQGQQNEG